MKINNKTKLFSYSEYIDFISILFKQGKVTGNFQSEALLSTTKMNIHRMNRIHKTAKLESELQIVLQEIKQKMIWYVIIESWCGDASQIVPFLDKMASQTNNIELKLLLRDDNPEIMDAYTTNGARAVPKLICVDALTGEDLKIWGPRPEKIQDMVYAYKKENPDMEKIKFGNNLHSWYAKDRGRALQKEFIEMFVEQHV